jgi:hypothetical protein
MIGWSRRAFLSISVGAVPMLRHPLPAAAQTPACVPGGMASFLPVRLTVDCASRRNFLLFRKYPNDLGLAGIVSMTFARGTLGSYDAGSMIVFPWTKPKGASRTGSAVPTNKTQFVAAAPVPDGTLPLDEYICNYRLQVPSTVFIGFQVDAPYSQLEATFDWFTNVKLADGKSVGIDWTSSNLNNPWFGGSRYIPVDGTCNGAAWRKLIVDGLTQVSTGLC